MAENGKALETVRNPLVRWNRQARTFVAEVRNELKRVTWPTRREVYATTFVVILTSTILGVYLAGVDWLATRAVEWIFKTVGAA